MKILGIDPGTEKTAWLLLDPDSDKNIEKFGYIKSDLASITMLLTENCFGDVTVGLECIQSFGMSVGQSVFKTCYFIGKVMAICEIRDIDLVEIYRKDVKMELCGTNRAKDTNIRQRLIDIYGIQGKKSSPGPTFGISADIWSALAIAHCTNLKWVPPY